MSVDTDNAKISDNQDEEKKVGGDMSTEDESSQESKENVADVKVKDNGDAKPPKEEEEDKKDDEDDVKTAENGKTADVEPEKKDPDDEEDNKPEKKGENGEAHDEDKKPNDVKKKKPAAKKQEESEEEEEEDEGEEEEEEEEEGEEGEEKKPAAKKTAPKKKVVKEGEDKEGDGEDEEGEDEEEAEGEEEEEEEEPQPKKKKEPSEPPVPVPAGKGMPLGHIPSVEVAISRFKIEDLKFLHQFLYNQLCRTNLIKRNIKKFKGYEFDKDSSDYKAKVEEVQKLEPKQIRMLCEMLDLDKRGSTNDLAARVVAFLHLPKNCSPHSRGAVKERAPPSDANTPGGRPRRSAAVKAHNRGYSDEEYESDPETKVRGPKVHRDESGDSDGSYNPSGSGQEVDSDFDPAAGEGGGPARKRRAPVRKVGKRGRPKSGKGKKAKVATPKRGGRGKKPMASESEDESESESGSEEPESDSDGPDSDPLTQGPPSKRGRGAPAARGRKPAASPARAKQLAAKRKAPAPAPAKKKAPPPTPKGKAKPTPGKKRGKQSSSEDESEEGSEEEASEEEGSSEASEEDQPLTSQPPAKKGKHPPTDDEIKKYVKQILEGANLEEITMKTVCKQVYSHYPDFDLAHKKDFIKATVKSLISS